MDGVHVQLHRQNSSAGQEFRYRNEASIDEGRVLEQGARGISERHDTDGAPIVEGEIAGLIRRAKSYDQAAFAELYRLAVTPVYRYLSTRLNTVEEAEDLTQEVFLAALSGIQGLRAEDETAFLAWIFQIARNKMADHLRQQYRKPTAPIDEAEQAVGGDASPDKAAEADEEGAELRRALKQLTSEQREVIVYKYVLEYGNERTARLVGKNANAVNQLHHRALASLHRLLTKAEKVK